MSKITDPNSIDFAVNTTATAEEFEIDTGLKTIKAFIGGTSILDDIAPGKTSGITGKALYSALKDNWLSNATLRRFKFPIKMIFEGSFIWTNGWAPADAQTRDVMRDAGFQETVVASNRACMVSLGSVTAPSTDQGYYLQTQDFTTVPTDYDKTGELNENIDITGSNTFQKSFMRIQGKTFSEYSLLLEQGLSVLNFQAYSFPLSNATDLKVDNTINSNLYDDTTVGAYGDLKIAYLQGAGFTTASLTGGLGSDGIYAVNDVVQDTSAAGRWAICITAGTAISSTADYTAFGGTSVWQLYDGEFQIGTGNGSYYAGNRVIETAGRPDREIYAWLQWSLRQSGDINDAVIGDGFNAEQLAFGTVNGVNAELLAEYIGDNLKPKPGVVLRNFDANSTNNIQPSPIDVDTGGLETTFVPKSWTEKEYPFKAAGNFVFSSNLDLQPDGDTVYTVYFDYIVRTSSTGIAITTSSGQTAVIDYTSAAGVLDHLTASTGGADGASADYALISGFTEAGNNGMWLITGEPTTNTIAATKVDSLAPVDEIVGDSIIVDSDPYESPAAVIVDNNAGVDMTGQITAATIGWDFDFTNNNQRGRTANAAAPIHIVALALDGAEWTDFGTTITKATGQNITVSSGDERNYIA